VYISLDDSVVRGVTIRASSSIMRWHLSSADHLVWWGERL